MTIRRQAGRFVVRDDPDHQRFELLEAEEVLGFADYSIHADIAVIPHTFIQPHRRGEGLGDVLVAGAVDQLRSRGLSIQPQCGFVADYLDRDRREG